MAYISTIDEHEAEGAVQEAYASWRERKGEVSELAKVWSIRPEMVPVHKSLAEKVTGGGSSLGRRKEELIAVVCSAAQACALCTLAHGEALREQLGGSPDLALRVRYDFRNAGLPDDEVAMLEYAETLTLAPSTINEGHVERLREVGFSDREIYDIALVTSFRNFISRFYLGLGVENHPRFDTLDPTYREHWTTFT